MLYKGPLLLLGELISDVEELNILRSLKMEPKLDVTGGVTACLPSKARGGSRGVLSVNRLLR